MKIWFNHWFSTVYRLMELIEKGFSSQTVEIVGTNTSPYAVYREKCTSFFEEPVIPNVDEYVAWCISFCKQQKIDIFIPRRNRIAICKNLKLFENIGVKVLVDPNYDLISMLEDKYKTAEFFEANHLCKIPTLFKVNTLTEFEKAYDSLKEQCPNERICIKYNQDEGATSFRVIDNSVNHLSSLHTGVGSKISLDVLKQMLNEVEYFNDLLVMPYLEGPEISIDSLMTKKGFLSVARSKIGSRGTLVEYNQEFNDISEQFAKLSGLTMPYNLQLRFHNGDFYLLEVNTRMAGGTHKSSELGVNFPYIALCELLGKPFNFPNIKEKQGIYVSQIETPIILKV